MKQNTKQEYRICTNCVMDTSDSLIEFDEFGVCNHCRTFNENLKHNVFTGEAGEKKLTAWAAKVKSDGKGKKYDCIFGISGGVDSTYLAYLLKKLGLRPLAVHFDYGWNTEIAVKNINNVVEKLEIDLYTYVIDWEVIKDLQYAYLKASVLDIDVPADQLIFASLFEVCKKNNVRHVVSGNNYMTESLLPKSWYFPAKFDLRNLKDIHRKYGKLKNLKYPKLGRLERMLYKNWYKIDFETPLNYINYNKEEVISFITAHLGWQNYGGKHFESIFTRFYQGYILPKKFNIDKRKAHLSNLIISGQLSRENALKQLEQNEYTDSMKKNDRSFFIKKMDLTDKEFDDIMQAPIRSHYDFDYERPIYEHWPILKPLKPLGNLIKRFL